MRRGMDPVVRIGGKWKLCEVVSYSSLAEEDGSGHGMSIRTFFSDLIENGDQVPSLPRSVCFVVLQEDDNAALVGATRN